MTKDKYIMFDFSGTIVRMRPASLLPEFKLLKKLSQNYRLGIITGAKRTETKNILKKLNIEYFFDFLITADDTSYRKPDRRLFPDLKINAYVGDSIKDRNFAENGKIPFFRVSKKCNINDILIFLIKNGN